MPPKVFHVYQVFVHIALGLLVVEVMVLSDQNRVLKSSGGGEDQIGKGAILILDSLRPLTSGSVLELKSRNLIFAFTTKCGYCEKNRIIWAEMADLWKENVGMVGIVMDIARNTPGVWGDTLNYPIFFPTNPISFGKRNRISRVPQTILVKGSGEVIQVWPGLLDGNVMMEIAESLPLREYP
jgi:hypothetical protein